MIIRTIYCDMKGCSACCVEKAENSGFPGWGHIVGLINDKTGQETAHVCPECKKRMASILNGEDKNDLG